MELPRGEPIACRADEDRGPKAKRPYLATECHDLLEADKWRQQVIRDIGRRVMEIQNAGLGEHKCVKRKIKTSLSYIKQREIGRRVMEIQKCRPRRA